MPPPASPADAPPASAELPAARSERGGNSWLGCGPAGPVPGEIGPAGPDLMLAGDTVAATGGVGPPPASQTRTANAMTAPTATRARLKPLPAGQGADLIASAR